MKISRNNLKSVLLFVAAICLASKVGGQQLESAEPSSQGSSPATQQAVAAEAAPAMQQAVEAEAELAAKRAAEAQAAELAVRQQELSRELTIRQQTLADLQSGQGIYSPVLIEAHWDIARLHMELEDYAGAVESLSEALQIARINNGLYSQQQLALLDELISQNLLLQQWEEVDGLVHLNHHIASRLYDPTDREYLAAAGDYGDWKLRVLQENLLGLGSRSLQGTAEDLSDFYQRILSDIELAEDVDAMARLQLLDGKSRADLSLARNVANTPYTYFQGTASPYITQQRCSNQRAPNGRVMRRCYNVRMENPRYRQSQQEAKRFALNRHTRQILDSLEQMQSIRTHDSRLSLAQRQQLDTRLTQLKSELDAIRRTTPRVTGF